MANRLMTKSEAITYCSQNGYKLFVDLCIREKVIVTKDPDPAIVVAFNRKDYPTGLTIIVDGEVIYQK